MLKEKSGVTELHSKMIPSFKLKYQKNLILVSLHAHIMFTGHTILSRNNIMLFFIYDTKMKLAIEIWRQNYCIKHSQKYVFYSSSLL